MVQISRLDVRNHSGLDNIKYSYYHNKCYSYGLADAHKVRSPGRDAH